MESSAVTQSEAPVVAAGTSAEQPLPLAVHPAEPAESAGSISSSPTAAAPNPDSTISPGPPSMQSFSIQGSPTTRAKALAALRFARTQSIRQGAPPGRVLESIMSVEDFDRITKELAELKHSIDGDIVGIEDILFDDLSAGMMSPKQSKWELSGHEFTEGSPVVVEGKHHHGTTFDVDEMIGGVDSVPSTPVVGAKNLFVFASAETQVSTGTASAADAAPSAVPKPRPHPSTRAAAAVREAALSDIAAIVAADATAATTAQDSAPAGTRPVTVVRQAGIAPLQVPETTPAAAVGARTSTPAVAVSKPVAGEQKGKSAKACCVML